MAKGIGKKIKERLGPVLAEHGFRYDESQSKPRERMFVYAKGEPERPVEWYLEQMKKPPELRDKPPVREEVRVYGRIAVPEVTVDLHSTLRGEMDRLSNVAGIPHRQWWRVATDEETDRALDEIIDLLNEYAWDWFVLK